MTEHASEPTRLEHWVHWSLLGGLVVSGLLMVSGLAISLASGEARSGGEPPAMSSLPALAARGDGVALLDLGLLVLMATPVLRVAVLAVGWGRERSWRMLAVALSVLALLGVSLALGVG